MPWYPNEDESQHGYEVTTYWEKLVSDYANVPIFAVDEMDYIYYLQLRKDAFIAQMSKTSEGQEYLVNAWRLSRTENDREKSRQLMRRGFGG